MAMINHVNANRIVIRDRDIYLSTVRGWGIVFLPKMQFDTLESALERERNDEVTD